MQVDTFGDGLYDSVSLKLKIYVADTSYGFPWIAIGLADSIADFILKMNDDDIYDSEMGILSLQPKVETLREMHVVLLADDIEN